MTRVLGAFVAICAIFGTTFGAIALGDRTGMPPFFAAGIRFTLGGALVLAYLRARGVRVRLGRADVRDLAVVALCLTTITFGTLYSAERLVPSGIAALIASTAPLFTVAFGAARGQIRFDLSLATGLGLGMLGTSLVVAGVAGAAGARDGTVAVSLAALALLVSEAFFAFGLVRSRALSRRVAPLVIAGGQMFAGGLGLLGLSLVFERGAPLHLSDPTALAALLYLTTVATAFAHSLFSWLVARAGATFASSWTYVSPFVALVVGVVALHERAAWYCWLGGGCVIVACLAVNHDQLRALHGNARREAA